MHRLLACFGNAEYGRLGLGPGLLTSQLVPRVCVALAKYDLESVSCGGAHTAVTTRGGLAFTFGLNSTGQCGHSPEATSVHLPKNVLLPEPVIATACGDAHTLCLTESGRVWAFGSNAAGQLGVGRSRDELPYSVEPLPLPALAGCKVVAVAAGSSHSLAVTDGGALLAWGEARHGRLGLGAGRARREPYECAPQQVSTLQGTQVARAFAGFASSACTDSEGRVYTWGHGAWHQLGTNSDVDAEEPRLLPGSALRRIQQVVLGAGHALARRADERVLLWGTDMAGSLGQGRAGAGSKLREPSMFKYWFTHVGCGLAHSGGISSDGRLYTWGWGGARAPGTALPQLPYAPTDVADSSKGRHAGQGGSSHHDNGSGGGGWDAATSGSGGAPSGFLPDGSGGGGPSGVGALRLGGGQLGVGGGVDLQSPTLVTKLEVLPGSVLRQDGGDPFNYQDQNLGWMFRQPWTRDVEAVRGDDCRKAHLAGLAKVSCGSNHTAAIIQVGRAVLQPAAAAGRELDAQLLLEAAQGARW